MFRSIGLFVKKCFGAAKEEVTYLAKQASYIPARCRAARVAYKECKDQQFWTDMTTPKQ